LQKSGYFTHKFAVQISIKHTRTDVNAKCQHDMQLPSISGVDSKLGLTMVGPSLQSAPEPPALDPPPISNQEARLPWTFLSSSDLDL